MKIIKLITLTGTALIALGQLVSAGPRAGGSGPGGGHFGGAHLSGYARSGFRPPALSDGARFNGRTTGGLTRAPQQFSYYGGDRVSGVGQHALVRQQPKRSMAPSASAGRTTITPQQNSTRSMSRQNTRNGNSHMTAGAVRRAIANHNVLARHDGNWHRDWDKHRAHFHHGVVFVFTNGFWWGLSPAYFPLDYYPYYAYDNYPYDSSNYPYDYYEYYPGYYDDEGANAVPDPNGDNSTVSAVQSALAKLGYYNGSIDGALGDATEAALARYQQDRDLSITGTVTPATLHALGLS